MDILRMFWSESFWLVPGYTWTDLKNKPGSNVYIPQLSDMYWSLPLGIFLLAFRYVCERYIVSPFGYWLGVTKSKRPKIIPNPILEKEFLKNGREANNNLEALSKQTDLSAREIQRWLRDREILSKPPTIQKFNECSWHFLFYLTSFVYGLVVLWNKPWFTQTVHCWKGWPELHISYDIYIYYLVELSFYWSLVFTTLSDHKRKDFSQMIVHHVVTMLLIFFSWGVNYVRIGTLVLLCHDVADVPMAAAKMLKYSGYKNVSGFLLWIFVAVWILSRLLYFPFVVISSSIIEIYTVMEVSPGHRFFQGLLIVLQILHLIWTYMIARIAMSHASSGEVTDIRSDSESE